MTSLPTEPIREEHRELLPHLHELERAATEVTRWTSEVAFERLPPIVGFLQDHLLPHALAEDEILYPAVDQAMGVPNATETMRVDHDEITTRVRHLRATITAALAKWPDDENIAGIAHQLSALSGIILLHFRKEEEVLLPILDSVLTVEEAEALFESMDSGARHQS